MLISHIPPEPHRQPAKVAQVILLPLAAVAHVCRECQREGRWLEGVSRLTPMDYYRCDAAHIWIVP